MSIRVFDFNKAPKAVQLALVASLTWICCYAMFLDPQMAYIVCLIAMGALAGNQIFQAIAWYKMLVSTNLMPSDINLEDFFDVINEKVDTINGNLPEGEPPST